MVELEKQNKEYKKPGQNESGHLHTPCRQITSKRLVKNALRQREDRVMHRLAIRGKGCYDHIVRSVPASNV
jgi:hypothetical protein